MELGFHNGIIRTFTHIKYVTGNKVDPLQEVIDIISMVTKTINYKNILVIV